jgi:enoyl-CoA hydratase
VEHRFHSVRYRVSDDVAVVMLDNPPVNGLNHSVRLGIVEAVELANTTPAVKAIVLAGAGRGFSGGGDIRELGTAAAAAKPALSLHVHPVIESSSKPVVAAMHGFAIGGGLETALACHFRVAAADTKIALPEIQLGLIPLSGTQRLPRAIGLQVAIDLILTAQRKLASEFADGTLFDALIDGNESLIEQAVRFARAAAEKERERLPLLRHRVVPASNATAILAEARARAVGAGPAAVAAVEAIAAAVEAADFEAGMAHARSIYSGLVASDEVRRRSARFQRERRR